MQELIKSYDEIICYTDGSSLNNPGFSGSGVAFFGKRIEAVAEKDQEMDSSEKEVLEGYEVEGRPGEVDDLRFHNLVKMFKRDDFMVDIDDLDDDQNSQGRDEPEEEFLFGLTLHIGKASNNYAEYVGVILAQLYGALFGLSEITILSDSTLVVQQIKGNMKTRNVRLVELIKLSHSLAFKYQYIYLSWIEREKNTIADKLSRYASQPRLISEHQDIFRVFFSLNKFLKK